LARIKVCDCIDSLSTCESISSIVAFQDIVASVTKYLVVAIIAHNNVIVRPPNEYIISPVALNKIISKPCGN
jgi:hypothetical protein